MQFKDNVKQTLVRELNLEDVRPEDIQDDAPLFGEGLGLDSLDAVELVVIIQKYFGVVIADMEEGRTAFQSINALCDFIQERKPQ
jgi:acyl carrier protein